MMKDFARLKTLLSCYEASALSKRNFLGQTALHLALRNPEIIKCFIDNGLSDLIDTVDHKGGTPLMYAAAYNQIESASLLIKSGADPYVSNESRGLTFLGYAMYRKNYTFVQRVIDFYRNAGDEETAQSLTDQCLWAYMIRSDLRWGDHDGELLRTLPQAKADLGKVSEKGNCLLHFATHKVKSTILLTETGYPINQQNFRGYTPLMVLSRFGGASLIQLALSKGAHLQAVDNRGMTALHHLIDGITWGGWNKYDCNDSRDRIDAIAVSLISGADALHGDSCRCACSGSGCTPTGRLLRCCRAYF
jgi:ankyrin repeat protein